MTNLNLFKEMFQLEMNDFADEMERFPWEDKTAYAYWLGQTYYFVRHSTRLLSLSAARFAFHHESLHQRFLHHVGEEKSHERLTVNDLKSLNFDIHKIPELPATSALYQSQYFWLFQMQCVSFLGYIFALEGIADTKGKEIYERVQKAHGEKASLFIKVHAQEDEEHLAKAFEQLSTLTDLELKEIKTNFKLSCLHYKNMLKEIQESTKRFTATKKTA